MWFKCKIRPAFMFVKPTPPRQFREYDSLPRTLCKLTFQPKHPNRSNDICLHINVFKTVPYNGGLRTEDSRQYIPYYG